MDSESWKLILKRFDPDLKANSSNIVNIFSKYTLHDLRELNIIELTFTFDDNYVSKVRSVKCISFHVWHLNISINIWVNREKIKLVLSQFWKRFPRSNLIDGKRGITLCSPDISEIPLHWIRRSKKRILQ